ncbi:fumarylacetoacetate hydrolase family protein [Arthrobacter sp. 7Tela_A1]|uniref:fumarylacetoacetate hydrolase family protein n=1 Tax=Arthrobacter sp. 7Tela_A1 TaxID=3093745 RepID=UPI003BB540A6
MKIARAEISGKEEYVVEGENGEWIRLSPHGITPQNSRELVECLDEIAAVRAGVTNAQEAVVERFLCPIVSPMNSLAIGRNYALHAQETGSEVPDQPMMFTKLIGSFTGANDVIPLDLQLTNKLDYEVELVVLIGRTASRVRREDALKHVAGYLVGNDVSARDCQQRDGQYDRAKGMDGFGPLGPWITTAEDVSDPQNLSLVSSVNGEVRQSSNTQHMIFDVAFLIEYLSAGITLHPGDVIWTGTPHGVALGMGDDNAFLNPGDRIKCEIDQLGALDNLITART